MTAGNVHLQIFHTSDLGRVRRIFDAIAKHDRERPAGWRWHKRRQHDLERGRLFALLSNAIGCAIDSDPSAHNA